jgi:hypothetical protein
MANIITCRRVKKIIDVMAFMFILIPILFVLWAHILPQDFPDGKLGPLAIAGLLSMLPAFFGVLWLIFRYANWIAENYPITMKPWFSILVIFLVPTLIFVILPIVRHMFATPSP